MTSREYIDSKQQIDVLGNSIVVHISFRNDSTNAVLIKEGLWGVAPMGYQGGVSVLSEPEFDLHSGDRSIPYVGLVSKRRPYGREDFIAFRPGMSSTRAIDISSAYEFLPGKHKYEIRHIHLEYDDCSNKILTYKSQPEEFWYQR